MGEKKIRVVPAKISMMSGAATTGEAKRRVAAYCRVSTDKEEQENSQENQVNHYTEYINGRSDWKLVDIYADEGISGLVLSKRDGFNRMIEDALDGKIDLIITKSVSRFGRNTLDSLSAIRQLKEKRVEVYFEEQDIWTFDPRGELLITIMASLSQEESHSISENVRWGIEKNYQKGKYSMAYSSFLGYRKGEDGKPEIDPDEAKIVERIYSDCIMGLSCKAIAKNLTEEHVPTPMKKYIWGDSVVRSILTNERYKGDAVLHKYYVEDYLTKKVKKNEGEKKQIYIENGHPAIIDRDQWELVQEILRDRSKNGNYSGGTIFSSKIRCGHCGGNYGRKKWGKFKDEEKSKYARFVWQCNNKYKKKTDRCPTPHLQDDEIKDAFIRAMNKMLPERGKYIALLEKLLVEETDTTELENERNALNEEMHRLAEIAKEMDEENKLHVRDQNVFRKKKDEINGKYEELEKRRDEVEDEIHEMNVTAESTKRFLRRIKNLPETLQKFDISLWSSLVNHVTVHTKENMIFHLTGGLEIQV